MTPQANPVRASRRTQFQDDLVKAADVVERHAMVLRMSYTMSNGAWPDTSAPEHAEHDGLVNLAKRIRKAAVG